MNPGWYVHQRIPVPQSEFQVLILAELVYMFDKIFRRSDNMIDREVASERARAFPFPPLPYRPLFLLNPLPAPQIWHLRISIRAGAGAGGCLDYACLARAASLRHFRHADVV